MYRHTYNYNYMYMYVPSLTFIPCTCVSSLHSACQSQ